MENTQDSLAQSEHVPEARHTAGAQQMLLEPDPAQGLNPQQVLSKGILV